MQITVIRESSRDYSDEEKITDFIKYMEKKLGVSENKELNLLLCDDSRISELNKRFLNREGPTDVISFYGYDDTILGDIAISLDTLEREAEQQNKDKFEHLLFLIAHGFLHLLGYEHDTMEDYEKMVDLQEKLIKEWKDEKNS